MKENTREKIGKIFAAEISLPTALRTSEIFDLVARAAGEHFHKVSYYRNGDCYVIGRRTGYGLGGDLIVTGPNRIAGFSRLWRADSERFSTYKGLQIFDCSWRDDFFAPPPTHLALQHPHDATIAEANKFVERLLQESGA
jgi:hypothetical protein